MHSSWRHSCDVHTRHKDAVLGLLTSQRGELDQLSSTFQRYKVDDDGSLSNDCKINNSS